MWILLLLDVGCWMLNVGCLLLAASSRTQAQMQMQIKQLPRQQKP